VLAVPVNRDGDARKRAGAGGFGPGAVDPLEANQVRSGMTMNPVEKRDRNPRHPRPHLIRAPQIDSPLGPNPLEDLSRRDDRERLSVT